MTNYEDTITFNKAVTFNAAVSYAGGVTGAATVQGADLVATDDLTVGDDATIGGDLAVTGTVGAAVVNTLTLTAFGLATLDGGVLLTLSTYADNAAAVVGGLAVGRAYKTAAGELRIVV